MDLRIMMSIFFLLGSLIAGALGIVPSWQSINESIAAKRNVEKNVIDLESYFTNFDALKKDIKENVTMERCNRLNNIAPAGIDLPQLLLQFDSLAIAHGSHLLGLNVSDPSAIAEDKVSLKKSMINASIPISLDNVLSFLDSVYHIERLVDIKSVKINVSGGSQQDVSQAAISGLDGYVYSAVRPLDCSNLSK